MILAQVLEEYQKAGGAKGDLWGPSWKNLSKFVLDPLNRTRISRLAVDPNSPVARLITSIFVGVDESIRPRMAPARLVADFFGRIERLEPLLRSREDEGCIKALGDFGILPTYSFPIYVDELRLNEIQPQKPPRCDLKLARDRRISVVEYYPGRTIVAGKMRIRSKGLWDGYSVKNVKRCSLCGDLTLDLNVASSCRRCGGLFVPLTAVIPWGGYYGTVEPEAPPPEIDYEEILSTDVLFDPASDPPPEFKPEGNCLRVATVDANLMQAARMRQFSPRPGSKTQLRLEQKQETDEGAPRSSFACLSLPSAGGTSNSAKSYYLLHEFTTDLIRIHIQPIPLSQSILSSARFLQTKNEALTDQRKAWYVESFWRTLGEALLIASARLLDIDEVHNAELGLTFRKDAACLDEREMILYDTAPGGAGYSSEIAAHLPQVFRRAAEILNECKCGDSCYSCLRSFRNQWLHSRLDRNLVKDGLAAFNRQNWGDPSLRSG